MYKFIKFTAIGCGVVFVLGCIGVFLLICYLPGEETEVSYYVRYHTKQDLYKISNVKFPEVTAVDSTYYASESLWADTVKFVLKDETQYYDLLSEVSRISKLDSLYWRDDTSCYIYHIIPEEPIDPS